MDILTELASRSATRGQEANVRVAERCVQDPDLLGSILTRLTDRDARLVGDCAEVMTKVAEQRPELVAPHAKILLALLAHKNGRVRWEAAHAVALVSRLVPRVIGRELERLGHLARRDQSVIVRDYVLDAIAGHAATGSRAAATAVPILLECASAWGSKHAGRILRGLEEVVVVAPKLSGEIRALAIQLAGHDRPGVRKAARSVLQKIDSIAA